MELPSWTDKYFLKIPAGPERNRARIIFNNALEDKTNLDNIEKVLSKIKDLRLLDKNSLGEGWIKHCNEDMDIVEREFRTLLSL